MKLKDLIQASEFGLILGAFAELGYFILWRNFLWGIIGAAMISSWIGWAIVDTIAWFRLKNGEQNE